MVSAVAPVRSAVIAVAVASDVSWCVSEFGAFVSFDAAAAYSAFVKMTFVDSVESVVSAAAAVLIAASEISSFSAEKNSAGSADFPASDCDSELSSAGSECCAVAVAKVSVWPVAEQTAD